MKPCAREGCPNTVTSTHPKARWCSNACKQAGWKDRAGYEVVGVRKASQRRRKRKGGRRLSLRESMELAERIAQLVDHAGYTRAQPYLGTVVREIFAEQRARLDGDR